LHQQAQSRINWAQAMRRECEILGFIDITRSKLHRNHPRSLYVGEARKNFP
jgi:hypothetical protein